MTRWIEISANRRAIAYILFSAVILGAMIAFGILPTGHQITKTRQQAQRLETGIEEQKIFQPLYQSLKQKTENAEKPEAITESGPIAKNRNLNIDNAAGILAAMAESAGMQYSSFSPVPGSMEEKENRLLVHGMLRGNYTDFRNFLISLVTSPACENLELLEAKSTSSHPEYRLRLWLAIE
ncbi:MAG: hypothetical protein K9J85_00085 [Desulfobacteraceae bacterium]|nr:hypothetical protein [Desulfobacteraceae bacterium]